MEIELGPRQRETIAAAITLGAVLVLLVAFSAVGWGLVRFVDTFQNVLLPPVVAGILTMLLRPYYSWLVGVCRESKVGALVLFFLSGLIPLGVFMGYVGVFATHQLLQLFEDLPDMFNALLDTGQSLWPQVPALLEKYGLKSEFSSLLENPGEMSAQVLQASWERMSQPVVQMFQSVSGLFAWAVLPLYLAFFLMAKPFEPKQISEFLPFLKKETREDVVYLFDQFVSILLTFFRGQIIIALLQGALFAAGFALIGLPYSIVIGMTLGLLNIIPYLGSIVGLTLVLPLAYFGEGGGIVQVALTLLVFGAVQAIEGYFLTPKIMGDRTGLHPALIIFAVFFWGVALGGIMGMLLAIPLTAFAVVFWRLLKKKYITQVV
ncbi:AI-2E family transporter [Marinospirillum sp.]|uniref:AI-2E family transporter n=1 Tax=Marinospirillum sp. TaxID=2183934 RepID=UPI00287094CE|nr:AI-2E family transporter [Marinospirillum sp.]MDR9467867.1 AI-2E family transporter [Marinospirillum sp.]